MALDFETIFLRWIAPLLFLMMAIWIWYRHSATSQHHGRVIRRRMIAVACGLFAVALAYTGWHLHSNPRTHSPRQQLILLSSLVFGGLGLLGAGIFDLIKSLHELDQDLRTEIDERTPESASFNADSDRK